ncbi:MAG: MATE family efflux transporter [Spirochaetaceae bacterium]|nr:MATE family efflux transporter [Spirochaetaceae bacterium]
MMDKRIEIFEKYSIPRAVATLCVPTILGMLISVVYNMVDTFFVGQTGDPNQVAAVSLTMPIFMMLMAIGNIFGIGGGSYISRLLGEKKYEEIKKVSSYSFYMCVIAGLVMTFVFIFFMPIILNMSGASEATYQFGYDYLRFIAYGAPFVVLSVALGHLVRSEGMARQSTIGMTIGTIINIILDPIMILWMKMGVAGAAIATIVGNIASVVYYLVYMLKSGSILSLSFKDFLPVSFPVLPIYAVGIPVSVNNILMSISNLLLNKFASFYGDEVVAGLGISNRVFSMVAMIFIGMGQGLQPFIGYNYAAKNYSRMNRSVFFAIASCVVLGTILLGIAQIFPEEIVGIFIKESSVMYYGAKILKAQVTFAPILGFMFVFMGVFMALGKGKQSLLLSVCRQGLVFVPVLIIANKLLGVDGVIWAQPLSDLFSVLFSSVMYIILYKKLKRQVL